MLELLFSLWLVVGYISARSSFPQPLSAAEEKDALERLVKGDREARRLLIEHNLRLVAHIAKKYTAPGCDADDCMANYVVSEINLRRDASFMRDYEAAEDWERPFFESRPWILQGAVDRIESVYGGVVPYLRAVGLGEGEVSALRARVLGD